MREENTFNEPAIVAYKLANESQFKLYEASAIKSPISDKNLRTFDFVFAPFDHEKELSIWFKFSRELEDLSDFNIDIPEFIADVISKEGYLSKGESLISLLNDSVLSKMVFSRQQFTKYDTFDAFDLFKSLSDCYLDAFVYFVYLPGELCWIGASPELLLREDDNAFLTVALAGTQILNKELEQIHWNEKEKDEHRFIETFFEESFEDLKIAYSTSDPYTFPAGKMCHIRSDFIIDKSVSTAELINTIHPGPALCGYPKGISMKKIKDFETHNRKYYTGFLGPLDNKKGVQLYANIRCMELFNNGLLLYVGGGYTKDSSASAEWDESVLKTSTLMAVLSSDMNIKS